MGEIAIFILDISKGEDVELYFITTASGIDGEQNGPGDEAANEADDNG